MHKNISVNFDSIGIDSDAINPGVHIMNYLTIVTKVQTSTKS